MCGHVPSVAVMIVTLKALRAQGGAPDGPVQKGFPNLARHAANVRRWGAEPVVALNRFAADLEADLKDVLDYCASIGVEAALSEGYLKGGEGMADLARKVVAAADRADLSKVAPLYGPELTFEQKITEIATKVYGAAGVTFKPGAKNRLQQYAALGYGHLPVCIAKTQYSFTDDAKVMGAPSGWTLTIADASLSAGAGFVVATAGNMMLDARPGQGAAGPEARRHRRRRRGRHGLLGGDGDRDQRVEYLIEQYALEAGALEIQYIEEFFGEFPRRKSGHRGARAVGQP